MRSRATNVLQIIVLLTGIIYIVVGLFIFVSPVHFIKMFSDTKRIEIDEDQVNQLGFSEDDIKQAIEAESESPDNYYDKWLRQILTDDILAPLYYITRGFSALLFTIGLAMVMPLFDPLKYRGLIYYAGAIFPFLASLMMFSHLLNVSKEQDPAIVEKSLQVIPEHTVLLILGAVFGGIFLITMIGLVGTKKQADAGLE